MKINLYTAKLFNGEEIPLASSVEPLSREEVHKQLLLYVGSKALAEQIKQWKEENNPSEDNKAIHFTQHEFEVENVENLPEEFELGFRVEQQVL